MSFRGRGGHALGAYAIGGSGPEEGWLIDGEFVGLEKRDGTFSIVQNQELETKGFVRALSNLQGFGATIASLSEATFVTGGVRFSHSYTDTKGFLQLLSTLSARISGLKIGSPTQGHASLVINSFPVTINSEISIDSLFRQSIVTIDPE